MPNFPRASHDLRQLFLGSSIAVLTLAVSVAPAGAVDPNALPVANGVGHQNGVISTNANGIRLIQGDNKRAVYHWKNFDLGQNKTAQFVQKTNDSIAVNRIDDYSTVDGTVTAKGQVWFLAKSGMMFGSNARVDVGRLLATTGDTTGNLLDENVTQYSFTSANNKRIDVEAGAEISAKQGGLVSIVAPMCRTAARSWPVAVKSPSPRVRISMSSTFMATA